jgi:spermidine/putrescine transport system substrate-binding protein
MIRQRLVYLSIASGMIGFWLVLIWFALSVPALMRTFYPERSISILAWPSVLNNDYIQAFEQKTGIKVRITYFEHNEELVVKMRSGGSKGYDLIMPADYVVSLLTQERLLKPVDHARCTFWPHLEKRLCNHPFDPNNTYTIPYAWSVYGIAFNTQELGTQQLAPDWSSVFGDTMPHALIGMIDDAREITCLGAYYLFKKRPRDLTHEEWDTLTKVLLAQKKRVAMYTDMRSDYLLLSGLCSVVVTNSSEIARMVYNYHQFAFHIPQEGSFWVIDSFALPVGTTKDELVYEFLNYLYQHTVLEQYAMTLGFSPALASLSKAHALYFSLDALPSELNFFDDAIPESKLNDLWITLKA